MFSFLNRLQVKKITVATADENGQQAQRILEGLLADLPELLMACVVEVASGKMLASYTTHKDYNPNYISLRYAKILRSMSEALASGAWPGGPLLDSTLMLDDQLHHLRPLHNGQWYCMLAVRTADANLGIAKEIMRRHAH
jgi:hypothetical protein